MRNGTLLRNGTRHPIRTLDLSPNGVQIETLDTLRENALGERVQIEIERIGSFPVKLLTTTQSGFEAGIVDAPAALRERIVAEVERLGVRYRPLVLRVQRVARDVEQLFEQALEDRLISPAQLFDTAYVRIGTAEPAQYDNASADVIERLTRSLVERELLGEPAPDFCLLQDSNGFNPVHNLRFSHPRRPDDRKWNLRFSRMRRIFDHRVGLTASRSLQPYIVQSHSRDLGDEIVRVMEFAAPIFAGGRHWGAVRMAYNLREE